MLEIEHILPEIKKAINEERLLSSCVKFANILSNDGWKRPTARRISIARDIDDISAEAEAAANPDVFNRGIRLRFEAAKEFIAYDKNGEEIFDEHYCITAELVDQILVESLPKHVLDELVKRFEGEQDFQSRTRDSCFYRSTEIEYSLTDVSDDQVLDGHATRVRYYLDEQPIYLNEYSWVEEVMLDSDIETEYETVGYFDGVFRELIARMEDDAIVEDEIDTEETNYEYDEHVKRAFGMMLLVSDRFIGMNRNRL